MAAPRSLTWFEGAWHEGNTPLIGPMSQAFWLGSTVFDGARAFEGVTPDLDQHCARVNRSAQWARLMAIPLRRMFIGRPMPDLQVPLTRLDQSSASANAN